jgi:hypothetical protein
VTDGLCFEHADDEKLARGWPNLVVAVDGDKQDKAPEKSALKAWTAGDPVYFTEWPRETLHRFMRGVIATVFLPGGDVARAMTMAGAPAPDEALEGLRRLFLEGYKTHRFLERDYVYAVESLAGTDATLDVIARAVEAFEVTTPSPGLNYLCRTVIVQTAAFLLLRASPAAATVARARLEKAFAAPRPTPLGDWRWYYQALDCTLNGADGVKRAIAGRTIVVLDDPLDWGSPLELAHDDPAFVRDMVSKADKKRPMCVRLAAIGGAPVLAGLEARKWPARQMPSVVRDFGMIRDPAVAKLMLSLVGKTSVKDGPLAWFRAHADYARPLLEKQTSVVAKGVLRQLVP